MAYPNFRPASTYNRMISTRPGSGYRAREIAAQIERREADDRRLSYWKDVAGSFNKQALIASQYENLGSERSFLSSMSKVAKKCEQETHQQFLERTRGKLRRLFEEESEALKTELDFMEQTRKAASLAAKTRPASAFPVTHTRFEQMRREAEAVEAQREQERRREAEARLYQQRRANCPELKQAESQLRRQELEESWGEQLKEKEEVRREEEEANKRYEEGKELERLRAEEEERAERRRKAAEQVALRDVLAQQVETARSREERLKALQLEERELLSQQRLFHEEQERRRQAEEARKKIELRSSLVQQCQAKLRRKAAEAREKLEEDRKLIESILAKAEKEKEASAEKRLRFREDVARMRQYLADQLELEKKREKEAENLFFEEARKLWAKREKEWALEDAARKQLMDSVISSWGQQIEEKLKQKRAEIEESRRDMWEAEKDAERARSAGLAEMRKKREEQAAMVESYEAQMAEKERKKAEEKRLAEIEAQKENELRKDEEAFVSEELRKMQLESMRMKMNRRHQPQFSSFFNQ